MSGQCCRRMIWPAMLLLVWASLIFLGGFASVAVLRAIADVVPQGPYHGVYVGLAVLVTWPAFTLALRLSFRHEIWDRLWRPSWLKGP